MHSDKAYVQEACNMGLKDISLRFSSEEILKAIQAY
jgi:hypothetical protein